MKSRSALVLWLSVAVLLLTVLSLMAGRTGLSMPMELFGADVEARELARLILTELRLPRTLLGLLVGASLGLCGAVLQGLTRNPLAEPGLLGVSSGAALGAVIAIYSGIGVTLPLAVPIAGLVGALIASLLTLALGAGGGLLVLVLAGAAVSALMVTGTALALNLAPNPYAVWEISQWLLGSLTDRSWQQLLLALPFMSLGIALLAGCGSGLNALSLGELTAASLGVDLRRLRWQALAGTALAVGAGTAVTGAIGFIGLLAPHLVRAPAGHEPSRVLLPSALMGAALLLAADIATRLLPFAQELKLGVLTGFVGAPFFVMLVLRMKRESP
ncbi:MAG: iron ABC transporter permease [Nevskiaceae bacterium]|nr:iron ABC transporter permease [Nevskiaceae bacterium]